MAFHFVSPAEALTPEYEKEITTKEAWVKLTFTGRNKPENETAGALVRDNIHNVYKQLAQLRQELNDEKQQRSQDVLILANHVALIENLLAEKSSRTPLR